MPARPRHRRLPIGRSGGRAGQARRWAGSPRSCFEFELGDHRILWGTIERLTLQPCNPANPAPTAPGMRTQAAKSFLEKPWHCLVARDCAQYQECSLLIQPPGYQGGGQTNGQRIQSGNAQTLPHSFVGQRNRNRAPSQTQQALQWEVAWKSGASGTSGARGATEHRVFCAVEPTVASGPAAPGVCLIPTFSTTQTLFWPFDFSALLPTASENFSDNPHTLRNHRLWAFQGELATPPRRDRFTASLQPAQPSTAPSVTGLSRILHRFHPNLGLRKHPKLRPPQGAKISRV